MALSATYFPDSGFTYAVMYGCDKKATEDITGRIENSEDTSGHPLLLPGILAELEHTRQIQLVEESHGELLNNVLSLSDQGDISLTSDVDHGHYSIESWLRVSHLRTGLENWKVQLRKMIEHCDELSEACFKSAQAIDSQTREEELFKSRMRNTGQRIKERLLEIIDAYDDKIHDCTMVMDGMTLATQLVSRLSQELYWLGNSLVNDSHGIKWGVKTQRRI
jgi:hypothetical protein